MNETAALLAWYESVKRDLPWRRTHDPYCIWISEIMLQQTRVETVKDYYRRFLTLFPSVKALADAPEQAVLKAWEGLGYYSRARNLQKAAQTIVSTYEGHFPRSADALLKLSGIGPYTAGAIASIAFGEAVPAIDGNVYRVSSRFFGIREDIASPAVQRRIREQLATMISADRPGDFNQAMMELGATVCLPSAPRCERCPWSDTCDARAAGDETELPVHAPKAPPRPIEMLVCLLTLGDRILVCQRRERMLKGLYVFTLLEDVTEGPGTLALLREQGLECARGTVLGQARHVFTHRIWNMTMVRYPLLELPAPETLAALSARLVTRSELLELPFPTAMKAARAEALKLLS